MAEDPYAAIAVLESDPYEQIAQPIHADKPGFFKRLGQSFGLPTTMEEVESAKPKFDWQHVGEAALGPVGVVGKMAYNYGETAIKGIKEGAQEATEVGENLAEGRPVLPNLGKFGSAVLHGTLSAVPIIGPSIETAGQDIAEKNYAGAAGGLTGVVAQVAAPEVLKRVPAAAARTGEALQKLPSKTPIIKAFVDGPPEDLMTRAVKPTKNNVGWNDSVKKGLPIIKSAEPDLGKPISGLDDALEATTLAKKNLWKQYVARLGPAGKMGAQIDGNAVADAMVNSIDKRTALQNPTLVERVKNTADTYRRPLGVDEAEDFLQSANKDLNSYYAKNKVGRQVALNDPTMSSTVSEAEALRDALYSKLDEVSGPGAADLKRQYGALTNVEKEMTGRQLVAARQQPQSLSEQVGTVRGYGKMARGFLTANLGEFTEGAENVAASRWLKERNSTDAMIARAFKKTQPAKPLPPPMAPMIRGQLPPAPISLGAVPETPPSFIPPPFENTTRSQRLGLLLPEPRPELPDLGYTEPAGEPVGTPNPAALQSMEPGTRLGQLRKINGDNFIWTGSRWIRASR